MKLCTSLMAAVLILAGALSPAHAQTTLYWDRNGATDGANPGGPNLGNGVWDTGIANWNDASTGIGATEVWTNGSAAVFSAGTDLQGNSVDAAVTVFDNLHASSMLVEEGHVVLANGGFNGVSVTSTVTIKSGARLSLSGAFPSFVLGTGRVILDGGTLFSLNVGTAASLIRPHMPLEITANGGSVGYDDGNAPDPTAAQVTIYMPDEAAGAGIFGTGGTPTAGVGTLRKVGPDEFRVQGPQVVNFSFEKLYVDEGIYRIGFFSPDLPTPTTDGDRGFGATPASLLTDQITLDGGSIGVSLHLTLHANRGITITPNGGGFYNTGGGVATILGPLTGSGNITVDGYLLDNNNVNWGVSTGGTTLSNTSNVSSFTGGVTVNSSTLTLAESLNATFLSGGVQVTPPGSGPVTTSVTTIGTIDIASGKTFTVGSNNNSTSYAGRVIGAGTFVKTGMGTLTLNSGATVHGPNSTVATFTGEWTNTGGVTIDAGTIRFGSSNSGFATDVLVTVNNAATLDMNNFSDTFGALASMPGHTTGQVLQGSGNLTLARTTGIHTYEGTITGTGNFNKGASGIDGADDLATQVLAGNNSLGAVNVRAGTLLLNGTNTTGAVTVGSANGGTLGGSGSVSALVTVANGGHIAPGDGMGTLTLGGGLTLQAGSALDFDLGAPGTSDLLNITLSGGLTINGVGTVNLTNAGGLFVGRYTLIDYTGLIMGPAVASFLSQTPNGPAGFHYALTDTGSTIDLVVTTADFNGDGIIDAADYVVWRKFNPSTGTGTQKTGDANADGDVNAADEQIWRRLFGGAVPGSGGSGVGGAVPEPSSVVLVMIGLAALSARRHAVTATSGRRSVPVVPRESDWP